MDDIVNVENTGSHVSHTRQPARNLFGSYSHIGGSVLYRGIWAKKNNFELGVYILTQVEPETHPSDSLLTL
jgi:hypothetical protein